MSLPVISSSSPTMRPDDPLQDMLSGSAPAFMGVFHGIRAAGRGELEARIQAAEAYLAHHSGRRVALMQALQPASMSELQQQVTPFPTAWPNASGADLAGYGAQLAMDVVDRRPSHYALVEGLRHLRQTSRFLPSIAEVMGAIDAVEDRLRTTAYHFDRLPEEIAKARRELDRVRQRVVVAPERLAALGMTSNGGLHS